MRTRVSAPVLAWTVTSVLAMGCFEIAAFECEDDRGCVRDGEVGSCRAGGLCSYPDPSCARGERYSANAGALAERCVEGDASDAEGTTIDAATAESAGSEAGSHDSGVGECPLLPDPQTAEPPCRGCKIVAAEDRVFTLCIGPLSWPQARDHCARSGLTLATIHSATQQQAIAASAPVPTAFWLGLNDRGREGTYAWIDLSATEFAAWAPEEPLDADTLEDCVVHQAEGWAVQRCELPNGYVCAAAP